jgi:hypothetical protein
MSTQILSKVKFMGKRTKGAPAPASAPPVEVVEMKAVEKRKEKKADGKKGAFSRFGVSNCKCVFNVLWLTVLGHLQSLRPQPTT